MTKLQIHTVCGNEGNIYIEETLSSRKLEDESTLNIAQFFNQAAKLVSSFRDFSEQDSTIYEELRGQETVNE